MEKRVSKRLNSIPLFLVVVTIMVTLLGTSCGKVQPRELYHRFDDKSWARFNLLSFEIPVEEITTCNVYLFARFDPAFQYETLDFNMIMNTPAGEERMNEYQMEVRSKSGNLVIECGKDSCEGTILLKKELFLAKPGILKVEIENLTPRLITEGVLGVGIRLVPSGK
jgi:gliding motility-associated lipoprotein GldH